MRVPQKSPRKEPFYLANITKMEVPNLLLWMITEIDL
jgi:hypothetical protein